MTKIISFLLFIIFFLNILDAKSITTNYTKFNNAKKNYARIIGYNNKEKEIKYLKELILYGNRLNKSTYKYKQELQRLSKVVSLYKVPKTKIVKNKYDIKNVYEDNNQIVILFNHKITKKDIRFFYKKYRKSFQYTFDIKGNFKDASPTKLSIDGITRIKIVQYKYKTLRITIRNNRRLKPIYILGYKKLIIKVKPPAKIIRPVISNIYNENTRVIAQKTIVIDAGHGGKDVGAIGSHRKYEKNVTLDTALRLYKILDHRGYKVYLTRNRDKFISLKYRTKMANKKNANMFISIHANAAPKSKIRKAQGIETYFLSPARSSRAKRVAASENKGDMNSMNWSSKTTFLTVLNQSKITTSNKMAIDIQKNILYALRKKYGKTQIKDGGVREGPFWVLVGAQMPSILIEVGYITHPVEGKRIYTKTYHQEIANAIANGVDSYFLKNQ